LGSVYIVEWKNRQRFKFEYTIISDHYRSNYRPFDRSIHSSGGNAWFGALLLVWDQLDGCCLFSPDHRCCIYNNWMGGIGSYCFFAVILFPGLFDQLDMVIVRF